MKIRSVLILKLPYCTHPDSIDVDNDFRTKATFRPIPSLALATVCAFLEKYKPYDLKIKAVDVNIEAYEKPGDPIDTSLYPNILETIIKSSDYDALCLSAMFIFNARWVDSAVRLSRKHMPNAKIIVGGGYPTIFPERCMKSHDIDAIVIGEGEASLLHILNSYNEHANPFSGKKFPFEGYGFKDGNGNITISKERRQFIDMSDVPAPAWHYLDVEKYFRNSGDRTLPIEGTRGCPYRCSYCSTYLSWGSRVRVKPVENMINEIQATKQNYSVETLHFVDDNMSFYRDWFIDFLQRFIKLKSPPKLTASNFSAKHLDEEIIALLSKAGMSRFSIAVESGSPEIQKQINKNIDFNKVREIMGLMKKYKMHVHICWMIGFPNETIDQINSTFNFARELRAHSNQFLTVAPYPGTKMFQEAKDANLLLFDDSNLDRFDNRKCDYLKSSEWTYNQLQDMIYDVNIEVNFLNNPYLDTTEGREHFLSYLENLVLKIPDHIISHIILGYLHKNKNCLSKSSDHYKTALKLLQRENLNKTFRKYLSWNNPIIKDFNNFIAMQPSL